MVVAAHYRIGGMTCASCSQTIEKHVHSLNGVLSVQVNLLLNEAQVLLDPQQISAESICSSIEAVGFDATLLSSNNDEPRGATFALTVNTRLKLAKASNENVHELTAALKQYQDVIDVVPEGPGTAVLLVTHKNSLSPQQICAIARAVSDVPVSILQPTEVAPVVTLPKDGANLKTILPASLRLKILSSPFCKAIELTPTLEKIQQEQGVIRATLSNSAKTKSNESVQLDIEYAPLVIGVRVLLESVSQYLRKLDPQLTFSVINDPPPIDVGWEEEYQGVKKSALMCTLPAIVIVWISMTPPQQQWTWLMWQLFPGVSLYVVIMIALATPIQWYWGREIHRRAWRSFKGGHITMDSFISFNTSFCYIFSILLVSLAACTSSYSSQAIEAFKMSSAKLALPSAEQLMSYHHRAHDTNATLNQSPGVLTSLPMPEPQPHLSNTIPIGSARSARNIPAFMAKNFEMTNNNRPLPAWGQDLNNGDLVSEHHPSLIIGSNENLGMGRVPSSSLHSGNLSPARRRRLGVNHVAKLHPEHGVPHYFETSALLITVVLVGKVFELNAKKRTMKELHNLNKTKGTTATLVGKVLLNLSPHLETPKQDLMDPSMVGKAVSSPSMCTTISSSTPRDMKLLESDNGPQRTYTNQWLTLNSASYLKLFCMAHRQVEKAAKPSSPPNSDVSIMTTLRILPNIETLNNYQQRILDKASHESAVAEMNVADDFNDFSLEVELVHCCSSLIQPGDLLRVEAGHKIPADGIIISCEEIVIDESLISGESLPVSKKHGDRALEGSVVYSPEAWIVATHVGKGSVLGQVIDTVRQASACSTPTGVIANKICSFFLPSALLVAMLTWGWWGYRVWSGSVDPFADQLTPNNKLMKKAVEVMFVMKFGISVLAIACPCALGLATPTATTVAAGKAVKFGVLVKNGSALELGGNVGNVVLDKTGTLTAGKPSVLSAYMAIDQVHVLASAIISEIRLRTREDRDMGDVELDVSEERETWIADGSWLSEGLSRKSIYVTSRGIITPTDSQTVDCLWAFLWRIIELIETGTTHPIAEAIINHCRHPAFPFQLEQTTKDMIELNSKGNIGGKGVMARLDLNSRGVFTNDTSSLHSRNVIVGSLTYCQSMARSNGTAVFDEPESKAWLQDGPPATVVCLFTDTGELLGALKLHDDLLQTSVLAVSMMQEKFHKCVWMCTGDNEQVARDVGRRVGILDNHIVSGASPWKKKELVAGLSYSGSSKTRQFRAVDGNLHKTKKGVIMVGDGSNDSLALVESDIGIAVGAGTNITALAADVILIKHDLEAFLSLINLSLKTKTTIKRNFVWAFVFNLIGLPVAAGILYPIVELPPLWSGFAMACSSLIVIMNSLLLFFVKPVDLRARYSQRLSWRQKLFGWLRFARRMRSAEEDTFEQDSQIASILPPFNRPQIRY
eukprot:Gregarina_sp_Poly_1__5101@NODE_26_length_19795_cov_50_913828_g24_i0_p2_GENE_NODE_26_length_19795_cov_50_913828_g24_i0NODE_26_length_19795_cov_50_913828_g24_i0_p2_ORF_typecomplete_len1422_score176_88E1E2_ATPase/PF00122_20/4_8e02E1E2_ATPase/PF00122_20/2_3e37Hydrolase/PF00702_26/3_1e25HMA/PF00403_26/4_9e14Hydrolase_3/PF08282_12/0_015_NODE_26_length_19795_cov_50_913828_g24_i0884613111